ncbi:MAG: hypothetical protein KY393_08260 [Actinobacteria bacterium]|nr:hypothetical protein [Actinomycetota bacterium]
MVSTTGNATAAGTLPAGVMGGLAGGIVFGMLMQMMDMLPMVAMLVGAESVAIGWLVHLAISAFIGAVFALALGSRVSSAASGAAWGAGYGLLWWVLGPLLIMPARLGMQTFMFNETTMQSLMGHLVYGVILGIVFVLVRPRLGRG